MTPNLIINVARTADYRTRTIRNAVQGITVAFAIDFKTAGERLTRQVSTIYEPINMETYSHQRAGESIAWRMKDSGRTILNIAGNGIYTLTANRLTQENMDRYVYDTLKVCHAIAPIEKIISGGQTGADEAGIKAAIRLGIPAEAYLPAGYRMRGVDGIDVTQTFQQTWDRLTSGIDLR